MLFLFEFHSWHLSANVKTGSHLDFILKEALELGIIFGDFICPFVGLLFSSEELKGAALHFFYADCVDTLNDAIWHGEWRKRPAFEYVAHVETEELHTPLWIPCVRATIVFEGNGSSWTSQ